jgi:hypothetical protein
MIAHNLHIDNRKELAMKIVGYILLACLLITLLQSLVIVTALVGLLALLWGACFRTRETFGLLLALLLFGLAAEQPSVFILVIGAVIVLLAIIRHHEQRRQWRRSQPTTPPLALPSPPGGEVWPAGGRDEAGDG